MATQRPLKDDTEYVGCGAAAEISDTSLSVSSPTLCLAPSICLKDTHPVALDSTQSARLCAPLLQLSPIPSVHSTGMGPALALQQPGTFSVVSTSPSPIRLSRGGVGGKWSDSGNIMEEEQIGFADTLEVRGERRRGIRDIILAHGLNKWARGITIS